MNHLAPDYIYTAQGLQANKIISIPMMGASLSIADVMDAIHCTFRHRLMLPGVALLPGFVNVHSHVFQRALRGHTHRPLSPTRHLLDMARAMYAEAQRLNPDRLYETALRTYREMLATGYTSVGEFHYVHHQPGGQALCEPQRHVRGNPSRPDTMPVYAWYCS